MRLNSSHKLTIDDRLVKDIVSCGPGSYQRFANSPEAFAPLIEQICLTNDIQRGKAECIKISSNAVFRLNDKMIKIFCPPEAGDIKIRDEREYAAEVAVREHAKNAGILVAEKICNGTVQASHTLLTMS